MINIARVIKENNYKLITESADFDAGKLKDDLCGIGEALKEIDCRNISCWNCPFNCSRGATIESMHEWLHIKPTFTYKEDLVKALIIAYDNFVSRQSFKVTEWFENNKKQ